MKYFKVKFTTGYIWIRNEYMSKVGDDAFYVEGLSIEDHSESYNSDCFENKAVGKYYTITGATLNLYKDDMEECTEEEFIEVYNEAIKSFNINENRV